MTNNGAKPPILDLDDLTEPLGPFRLDGVVYEFRRWNALSLRERNRVGRINERLQQIEQMDEPGDEEESEYTRLVHELVVLVSSMPLDAAQSSDQDKVREAATAFLGARQARQIEMVMKMAEMTGRSPIGATSSPASNRASRRARRKAG